MTTEQIKKAVDEGKKVYWVNELYQVIKDRLGQYLIVCLDNGYTVGLTHSKQCSCCQGKTLRRA